MLTVQQKITVPSIYFVLEAHGETVVDPGVGVAGVGYVSEIGLKRLLVHGEWGLELFDGRSEGMVYCPLDDGEAERRGVEGMCE